MGYGDNARMSPSMSTVRRSAPSTVKQQVSPSKPEWNMAQGYDDFFNREDDKSDDNLKIEDSFDHREHLCMTQAVHKAA